MPRGPAASFNSAASRATVLAVAEGRCLGCFRQQPVPRSFDSLAVGVPPCGGGVHTELVNQRLIQQFPVLSDGTVWNRRAFSRGGRVLTANVFLERRLMVLLAESVISRLDSTLVRALLPPGLVHKLAKSTVAFGRRLEAKFTPGLQSVLVSPPSPRVPTKGRG
jgi:hypothetical protein